MERVAGGWYEQVYDEYNDYKHDDDDGPEGDRLKRR